jgi:Flp pilus assembly protein TadB
MSKERARRRAAREHEAALRAAARAAEQERRERREARRRALKARTTDRVRVRPVGRPTGTLATRRRHQTWFLVAALVLVNALLWWARPDWEARLGAAVVTVLAFPVLRLLLFSRR